MGKIKDIVGAKFNKLTVIRFFKIRYTSGGKSIRTYECECDCGNKNIIVDGQRLSSGNTKSCGCLNDERRRESVNKYLRKYNEYDVSNYEYGIGYLDNGMEFYFDLEDFDKIKDYYWFLNEDGYVKARKKESYISLHKLITNTDKNTNVDHIYHNEYKLDNRKNNLRLVTKTQNSQNHVIRSDNTSGVSGVYWHKKVQKWIATICVNYNKIHLGTFNNIEDAIRVRKETELQYFGEYVYKGDINPI